MEAAVRGLSPAETFRVHLDIMTSTVYMFTFILAQAGSNASGWSHIPCAGENDPEPLIPLPLLPKHTATLKLFSAGDGAQGFLHVGQSHIGSSQVSAL